MQKIEVAHRLDRKVWSDSRIVFNAYLAILPNILALGLSQNMH
jgi:hypothetical protein